MVICSGSAIRDFLNHLAVLGSASGAPRDLLVLSTPRRGDRLGPLGHDNLHPPVLAPAFFRVVGRNRSGVCIPDCSDSVGTHPTFDQSLAGMFGPRPGKVRVILIWSPTIVLDRCAVGMSGDFDALRAEFTQ